MVSSLSTSSDLFYRYHYREATAPTQSTAFVLVSLLRRINLCRLRSILNTYQLILSRNSLPSKVDERDPLPDQKPAVPLDAHRTIVPSNSSLVKFSPQPRSP